MLRNLNATRKGLITALLMTGLSFLLYYAKLSFDSPFQYIIYIVYAAGIVWTLLDFSRSGEHSNKFGSFFLQGFKCFIVVTLVMVVYTFIFNKLHPEFKDLMVLDYKKDMISKGNTTPAEIETNIAKAKDYYDVVLLSGAVFGYLIIGAVVTALTSLLIRKRNG